MFTLPHAYIQNKSARAGLLNFILPRLVGELKGEFCRFADGGAGIGSTGLAYAKILRAALSDEALQTAKVVCYEPLPENLAQLTKHASTDDLMLVRPVAVSDSEGEAHFQVPSRLVGDNGSWVAGTSYAGFLGTGGSESLTVQTVRLDNDFPPGFDFVKLDLQGGEIGALRGLGTRLADVKLLYVETQLMAHEDQSPNFLLENGFVIFFDSFQFGVRNTSSIDIEHFSSLGLNISKIHLPNAAGAPLTFMGNFSSAAQLFDPTSLTFKKEMKQALAGLGVYYFQTDTLAVSPKILPLVMRQFAAA